jgi:hypothetical protein
MIRVALRSLLATLLGGALLAVPAHAQLAPGRSGFSDAPTVAHESEYWEMMGNLGECLARIKAEQARAFVESDIDSAAESEAFELLFNRTRNVCLGNFVRAGMLRSHVRGVVAEGLFKRMPAETVANFTAAPPAAPAVVVSLHDFARCYVVSHPATARRLIEETRVATKGETEFVRGIASDFGPCLPQGTEITIRPTSVRMAIAEALYRAASGLPAPTIQEAS